MGLVGAVPIVVCDVLPATGYNGISVWSTHKACAQKRLWVQHPLSMQAGAGAPPCIHPSTRGQNLFFAALIDGVAGGVGRALGRRGFWYLN